MRARPSRYIAEEVKRSVIQRSSGCFYCGVPYGPFEFDHFLPVKLGGANDDENVVLACLGCNREKGGKHPSAYLRKKAAESMRKAQTILRETGATHE